MLEILLGVVIASPFVVWVIKDSLVDVAYWEAREAAARESADLA